MEPRTRRLALRIGLALATALAVLLGLEVALRVRAALGSASGSSLAGALENLEPLPPGGKGRWLHVLRTDANERITYGLRPGFDGLIEQAGLPVRVTTNSHGFRGPEWTVEKPPRCARIVGIGDSIMMGFAIEVGQTYLALLEQELNRVPGDVRFETLNLAVGGYNTVQEVETLRAVGLEFEPDLVLLNLIENDIGGILYGSTPSVFAPDRSFLLELLAPAVASSRGSEGWEAFSAALEELREMRDEHGFEVLVFTPCAFVAHRRMLRIAAEKGLRTLDMQSSLERHIGRRGITDAELVIPNDGHPSALHNELIATDLAEALEAQGLLQFCRERQPSALRESRGR